MRGCDAVTEKPQQHWASARKGATWQGGISAGALGTTWSLFWQNDCCVFSKMSWVSGCPFRPDQNFCICADVDTFPLFFVVFFPLPCRGVGVPRHSAALPGQLLGFEPLSPCTTQPSLLHSAWIYPDQIHELYWYAFNLPCLGKRKKSVYNSHFLSWFNVMSHWNFLFSFWICEIFCINCGSGH